MEVNPSIKTSTIKTVRSDNADHNYSDSQSKKLDNIENTISINSKNNVTNAKSSSKKEKFVGTKITNVNDLKKATPRLKLPTILSSSNIKAPTVPEVVKQTLLKYCRTCAGQKVPLVDIFSEKGMQMRLSQQIQHLEDIHPNSLSTQMCMDCICDMKMSYKFFMQIKKAEIKLKSIHGSLNESLPDTIVSAVEDQPEMKSEIKSEIDLSVDNNFDKDIKCEPLSDFDANDHCSDDNFEEFDPDDPESMNKSDTEISEPPGEKLIKIRQSIAYKYDQSLNAYIRIDPKSPGSSGQLSKIPNILKRKLSTENISDDNTDKSNKIDIGKLKIPKLDLQDVSNIKKDEDGVMYVTAKGSKPNEMLLIKVKKMDKSKEKKGEKLIIKKKPNTSHATSLSPKDIKIEEQIEQYKKKRVQIFGDTSTVIEETFYDDRTSPAFSKDSTTEVEKCNQFKREDNDNVRSEEDEFDDDNFGEISVTTPEQVLRLEKLKKQWRDIRKRHETITKDLSEDCTDRLRLLLKQKEEYLLDFINYLKQRKIVASRLRDEDIIALYEAKNNVTLDRSELMIIEEPEEDPFEERETFTCDFCSHVSPNRDMEFEHSKIHDFRLMHYCEDCKTEFATHKAKRAHNVTCVQKLMCKYCDMILESKGKKRQHEQKHCDEQYGQLCDICGEKFKHVGTLDQHVKSRHMQFEKIFKCPQCPKKFAFRTKLTFHLKSVHTTCRAYLCEDCGSDFKNPASLRHHRLRKHQLVHNKKECSVCHKMIPVYSMSKHMHTHKSYSIECPHCDKMFKNTSTLKQHLKIHEDQRQFKCDMCGVGFNRRDGLKLHMKVHLRADSKGLKECCCQVCGEKFSSHSMLVIHRNRTHKDGRNYTCHICNRSMISSRSLEWHLAHIHNEAIPSMFKDPSVVDLETKRVSCCHCDKTFKTEMILRNHVKNSHVQKEPMKCLDCDEMFQSEVRLKHHMMVAHNRLEGTLSCPHCPKRFVNQLRLKTHMISHSNERPYSCDLCGFMLKTKIQLIKHKQNRHSNERPLQCKYCSWRCKQVSALVCHERTHTNERPYSCRVCLQKFKYLGDKNKHERRHESLGGTGFKRIVTGRNTNKNMKRDEDSTEQDSEQEYEHEEEEEYEVEEEQGEYDMKQEDNLECEDNEEQIEEVESFDESQIVKFQVGEVPDESETQYEEMYVEETSQDTDDTSQVVMNMEETTVYTEEVTSDNIETEIIKDNIIDEHVLQPGTVVHIQQEDETGKIQMIPVMLSLPDLSDATSEVNLENASPIMYNN